MDRIADWVGERGCEALNAVGGDARDVCPSATNWAGA